MSYLTEVIADSPAGYWRCADPGGRRLARLISGSSSMIAVDTFGVNQLPYTGPNSNGGSVALGNQFHAVASGSAAAVYTFETMLWACAAFGSPTCYVASWLDSSSNKYVLRCDATGFNDLYLQVAGSTVGSHTSAATEAWHHIAIVQDATHLTFWLNAVQQWQISALSGTFSFIPLYVGGDGISSPAACQWQSEIAVYHTALSPTRITAHFLALDNVPSSPVWKGTSASDTSLILSAVTHTYPAT